MASDAFYFMLAAYLMCLKSDIFNYFENYKCCKPAKFVENFDDILDEYEFIIIGAGSAGSVVAQGVSKSRGPNLLIEAGGHQNLESKIPSMSQEAAATGDAWQFRTSPQKRACLSTGGECPMPRGKMMGGTSTINTMIYLRGNPKDYDKWASQGNPGWEWDSMFKHFYNQERITDPELSKSKFHNTKGLLMISRNRYKTELASEYLKAGKQLGFDVTDLNGAKRTGFMYYQGTITDQGIRASSNREFLADAPNLMITRNTLVTKILFDGNKAYGVIAEKDGQKKIIRVKKEILLCAGTISSPQLLMLSGIGPKEVLSPLGISVIADLPVGRHLQDHLGVGLNFRIRKGVQKYKDKAYTNESMIAYGYDGSGPLSSPMGTEALAFVNATEAERLNDYPSIALILSSFRMEDSWRASGNMYKIEFFFPTIILGFYVRPKSFGNLTIRSTNLNDHPIINPNYLDDPDDFEKMIQIVKYCIQVSETPAMKQFETQIIKPTNCQQPLHSREFAECMVREYSTTLHHQVGTCRMDKNGVVDYKLKVHGIEGLRVIDASIMPSSPSSNINAIIMAIAGKGIELLKDDYDF